MGEKLVVGSINRGFRNDRTAFVIDNDSFPTLINAYQWRGRVKRKRGTSLLGRLQRFFNSLSTIYNPGSTTITLTNDSMGNGLGNILTGFTTLQTNANLVPGSITINDETATFTYTDPMSNGILTGTPTGSGTIDYATGAIFITGAAGDVIDANFIYYPDLPVMGLEDLILISTQFPGNLAFDTIYSYNIVPTTPNVIYDVSFYNNPLSGTYPGHVQKALWTPTTWNGQDYRQFWTVNYQGALWATNGIEVPFTGSTIGMQFKPIVAVTVTSGGPPAIVNLQITGHGLLQGDFVFINEVITTTGINFQTGYVTTVVNVNNVTVEFPNATIATNGTGGIAQYLTNRSNPSKDCLRWYNGDPTNGSTIAPAFVTNMGWVNFMPPLSEGDFSIANLPAAQYYLVGARIIFPFKDRLVFFGPVVQTSTSTPIYLQDTVIFSQNGTPYYTASYTNTPSATVDTPTSASNVFFPILVPEDQTATSPAWFEDQTGFGGSISAGLAQPIITVSPNEDVLILGFSTSQVRMIYTGTDLLPFILFVINSELGSSSTFSVINMDKSVFTRGGRGFVATSQVEAQRIDLEIPDQVFEFNVLNNGTERITSQRDFINEWVYFTYLSNEVTYIYPNQTLQYNYRDESWAIFNECYTTYGTFRQATGKIWSTIGFPPNGYPMWQVWNVPWSAGASTLLQPQVIGGNQQGFIMIRNQGTDEGTSLYIQNISGSTVTSPNHCLNEGDYVVISGALGTVATQVNGLIFSVATPATNTFILNPSIAGGTYTGGGLIQRMYVPFVQTKQFPTAWGFARKVRIGPQQYLLSRTPNGQIILQIYLSQDNSFPYNSGTVVPATIPDKPTNNSLIYSQVLSTAPDQYIQNCNNLSLGIIGNGILTSFTFDYFTIFTLQSNTLVPGSIFINVGTVATFTDNGTGGFNATGTGTSTGSSTNYNTGMVVIAFTTAPTTQQTTTNFQYTVINIQTPTAPNQEQIWHRINTSLLGDTVQLGFTMSDSQMRDPTFSSQFEEIEIHGFILDVNPSQVLS